MIKQPLAQSVLLANKAAAEALSKQMLAQLSPNGKPTTHRQETPNGFMLLCMMQTVEGGPWKPSCYFEFAQLDAGPIIRYDPRIVSLQELN